MENDPYASLRRTISKLPLLYRVLDDAFIEGQCAGDLKNFLLVRSDNVEALQHLEGLLQQLSEVKGYDRLGALLRGACDWDGYQEMLAQIEATLWFKQQGLLTEIEPALPHRPGSCDILLSFSDRKIYCEVWSAQSFLKAFESKKTDTAEKAANLRKIEPWMSQEDAEHEIRNRGIVRTLKDKTNRQLPPDQQGILWIDGAKGWVWHFDVKVVAKRLFPLRPQMALIMLWTLGRGSQLGEPPFCFINSESPFQDLSRKIILHLGHADHMAASVPE